MGEAKKRWKKVKRLLVLMKTQKNNADSYVKAPPKRFNGLSSSSPFKLVWDLVINSIFTISFMMIPLVLCSKMSLLGDF